MKNADRINFYAAGLRAPPQAGGAPGVGGPSTAVTIAAPPATKPAAPILSAPVSPHAPASATLRDRLPAMPDTPAGMQQASVLDQAKLHHLLQRLDGTRQRQGDHGDQPASRRRNRHLAAGLFLALVIIVVQASAAIWLYQRAELLLGRPLSPALLLTATDGDVDVIFRPSASTGDISVLLRELNLHIVDGPDDAGRYVVRPENDVDGRTARDRALNALRDHRDLVYSAAAN
jgi:hypothetical protein